MRGAALLAVLALAAPPAPREHGPIPLYQPDLKAPVEAAGTGLRPLVRAKLGIDASGKVIRVDVGTVDPSSEFDEAFRTAARTGLSAWRFAAAEKDGQAVASETSVALQFEPAIAPRGVDDTGAYLWSSATDGGFESFRYSYRAQLLGMEPAARRKIADEFSAKAEALLRKETRVAAADDWFEVVTDFGGQKQADALLHNLNATYYALYKLLGERVPPLPRGDRIRAYVFETNDAYQKLVAQTAPFEGSAGIYFPAGVLAFYAQHAVVSFFLTTMLHEATHAFVDRHVIRHGVQWPRWLDEGLAEYVGNSDIKDGKIVPGGHAKSQVVSGVRGAIVFWSTISKQRADEAKHAQRQKRALTLEEIVSAGPETFYGKDVDLYYSQGWLAVHFLRHGRPGWTDDAFPKFLLYTAEGYPASQAMKVAYGVEARELETSYQKYVKSF